MKLAMQDCAVHSSAILLQITQATIFTVLLQSIPHCTYCTYCTLHGHNSRAKRLQAVNSKHQSRCKHSKAIIWYEDEVDWLPFSWNEALFFDWAFSSIERWMEVYMDSELLCSIFPILALNMNEMIHQKKHVRNILELQISETAPVKISVPGKFAERQNKGSGLFYYDLFE